MHKLALFGVFLLSASLFAANSIYDFTMKSIDGQDVALSGFKGKVARVVNVASQCGYTPQYKGLENLYRKYKDQNFAIIGVPANNFGGQEPGSDEEIKQFCTRKYSVTFPMMAKVSVKGSDMAPLYQYLQQNAGEVRWNFTKFLVGKDGKVIKKFDSAVTPESSELASAIEQALRR